MTDKINKINHIFISILNVFILEIEEKFICLFIQKKNIGLLYIYKFK